MGPSNGSRNPQLCQDVDCCWTLKVLIKFSIVYFSPMGITSVYLGYINQRSTYSCDPSCDFEEVIRTRVRLLIGIPRSTCAHAGPFVLDSLRPNRTSLALCFSPSAPRLRVSSVQIWQYRIFFLGILYCNCICTALVLCRQKTPEFSTADAFPPVSAAYGFLVAPLFGRHHITMQSSDVPASQTPCPL